MKVDKLRLAGLLGPGGFLLGRQLGQNRKPVEPLRGNPLGEQRGNWERIESAKQYLAFPRASRLSPEATGKELKVS